MPTTEVFGCAIAGGFQDGAIVSVYKYGVGGHVVVGDGCQAVDGVYGRRRWREGGHPAARKEVRELAVARISR